MFSFNYENQESKKKKTNCNCRIKEECPLENNCNIENVVYQAKIYLKERKINKTEIGISSLNWKLRYYNYKQSFYNPLLRNQMAQSKYYWELKDHGLTPIINWEILKKSSAISSLHSRCKMSC